jgi:hypothetical protein
MSVLARVQSNPEILTDDPTYVADLVTRAKSFVERYCSLPRFPESAAGYSQSAASAAEDITAAASNRFWLVVNDSPMFQIALDLANCNTGANTAAEMQAKIRAVQNDYFGLDEVVVTFAATRYTITSGRTGERSRVTVFFDEPQKHVCQLLKLSPHYGGTEKPGFADDDSLIDATVQLVEQMYRKLGVEGLQSMALHQGEFGGAFADIADPLTLAVLKSRRRLWLS